MNEQIRVRDLIEMLQSCDQDARVTAGERPVLWSEPIRTSGSVDFNIQGETLDDGSISEIDDAIGRLCELSDEIECEAMKSVQEKIGLVINLLKCAIQQ